MDIIERCSNYLSSGGLFNPEFADHDAVRDLVINCRDEIERLRGAIITNQSVALDALATHGQLCDEIERLREALLKITHHLDDNRHPLIVKNEALAALGLPLRELPWEKK